MIYIVLTDAEAKKANQKLREQFPSEGDAFIVNRIDKSDKDEKYCVISLPDNGSAYVEMLKRDYGYTDFVEGMYNSRNIKADKKTETDSKDAKIGKKDKSQTIAALSSVAD